MVRSVGSYAVNEIVTVPKRLAEQWVKDGYAKYAGFREGVIVKGGVVG
jgi:hypothetical protein